MLVRIVRDWDSPNLMRQTPAGKGMWDGVQFTEAAVDTCDYLIALNPPKTKVKVKAKQTWLFTQEPPVEYYDWHKAVFPYFDKVFTQHPATADNIIHDNGSLPWHIGKTYDELVQLQPQPNKENRVSTVTSNAYERPGHKARYDLIQYLREIKFDLELFGRGIRFVEDKYDGIAPYKYSIAIENSFYPHYWTEKISDCLLAWTMPIYAGCPNITDYFPEEALLIIDPFDQKKAKEQIEEAISNNRWQKNLEAIGKARQLMLEDYQFFPAMVKKIRQFEKEHPNPSSKTYKIPRVPRPKYGTLQQRVTNRIKSIFGAK